MPEGTRPAGPGSRGTSVAGGQSSRYQLVCSLGAGGMGEIFDSAIWTLVAISLSKVIREESTATNPKWSGGSSKKPRSAASSSTRGSTPIHDVGRFPDGRLFIAMKLAIRGRTLAALLDARERRDEDPEDAILFRSSSRFAQADGLCSATAEESSTADLKPSNIMVGAFGEVQVMDWGPAKAA